MPARPQAVAEVCALCNEAQLEVKNGAFRAVGAPTEAALVCLVEKLGCAEAGEHSNLAALRKSSPETCPMPVTKAYGARCGPALGVGCAALARPSAGHGLRCSCSRAFTAPPPKGVGCTAAVQGWDGVHTGRRRD